MINVSWVKNVARQFGCIFARCIGPDGKPVIVRKEKTVGVSGLGIVEWHVSKLNSKREELKASKFETRPK